jgi:hypothetical protein
MRLEEKTAACRCIHHGPTGEGMAAKPGFDAISAFTNLASLQLPSAPTEKFRFQFDAAPGLYQFSVILDAREFDWEQLYENLNKFHNNNERTGPWDFSINFGATPLVPSYWVSRNGRRIGLWFFQRVSLEDIRDKRFRGRMAFYAEGPTTLEFEPYQPGAAGNKPSLEDVKHEWTKLAKDTPATSGRQPFNGSGLRWISALLEKDPEDLLEPLPSDMREARASPAARWADEAFWAPLRSGLAGSYAAYAGPLKSTAAWVMKKDEKNAEDVLMLFALARLDIEPRAMERALATVDSLVGAPTWGNPNPDGYSHNGDMGAMSALKALAWAWHAMAEEMGPARRARVQEKLRLQGGIFFDLALLNRDYWGGSLIQDHGWRSMFGFGAAALHLLGVVPEAECWVRYVRPRLRRSLTAMPRDGVVPPSSWDVLGLYMNEVTQYRDTLLALTGEDIFEQPQFPPIIDCLVASVPLPSPDSAARPATISMSGGNHFLNRMALKYRDGRASHLQHTLLTDAESPIAHPVLQHLYYLGAVQGIMSEYPGMPAPEPLASRTEHELTHFSDSGRVLYRDEGAYFVLSCGPFSGFNAYQHAHWPCDRLGTVPGEGHFLLAIEGVPLLCTPEISYKLQSISRTCLLIDGRGQYGDIGYPMSIPSKRHRGEQIREVRWDASANRGFVRLDLQPAYEESLGLTHYTRDFLFEPRRITVRDTVVLGAPRSLSWLFQGQRDRGVAVEGLVARFGKGPFLCITPRTVGAELQPSVHPTPIVYSYSSSFQSFDHARYDTKKPTGFTCVEFALTW